MCSAFNETSCFYTVKTFKVPAGFPKALHIIIGSVTLLLATAGAVLARYCLLTEPGAPSV